MTACLVGPLSVVEFLLRHGADPNKGISGGYYEYTTPLARCCADKWGFRKENGVQLCDLLIKYGAFLDSTDGDDNEHGGRSPLMVASDNGNLDLMRLLLDRGAGVEWAPHPRWSRHPRPTVLTDLCYYHAEGVVGVKPAVAQLLISRGAEVDNETGRWTPLKYAQKHRRTYPESDLYALFDPVPPPPRVRLRTHWRLRILFHVVGRRACHPRSKRHELGQWRISDVAAFLLPRE